MVVAEDFPAAVAGAAAAAARPYNGGLMTTSWGGTIQCLAYFVCLALSAARHVVWRYVTPEHSTTTDIRYKSRSGNSLLMGLKIKQTGIRDNCLSNGRDELVFSPVRVWRRE